MKFDYFDFTDDDYYEIERTDEGFGAMFWIAVIIAVLFLVILPAASYGYRIYERNAFDPTHYRWIIPDQPSSIWDPQTSRI